MNQINHYKKYMSKKRRRSCVNQSGKLYHLSQSLDISSLSLCIYFIHSIINIKATSVSMYSLTRLDCFCWDLYFGYQTNDTFKLAYSSTTSVSRLSLNSSIKSEASTPSSCVRKKENILNQFSFLHFRRTLTK